MREHAAELGAAITRARRTSFSYVLLRVMTYAACTYLFLPNVALAQFIKEPTLDRFGDPLPPNALVRLGTVRFREANISHVKFSPDGMMLATCGHRNVVSIWDANTGRLLRELGKGDVSIITASFTPDGKYLVSAAYDGKIQIHNPRTGEHVRSFQAAHTYSLAISSDGKRLVTKAGQKQFKVWSVETGDAIVGRDTAAMVDQIEFSPDGKILCVWNTYGVEFWDTERWQLLTKAPGYNRTGKFTRDPNLVLYVSNHYVLTLWDIKAERVVHQYERERMVYGIDVHPTEAIAVSGSPDGFTVWDLKNGGLLKKCRTNMFGVWEPSFSRDGKRIAVCSNGGIEIWDTAKWEPVLRFDVPASPANLIGLTDNGKELVSVHECRPHLQISRWDVNTSKETYRTADFSNRAFPKGDVE